MPTSLRVIGVQEKRPSAPPVWREAAQTSVELSREHENTLLFWSWAVGDITWKGGYSGQREQHGQKHRTIRARLVQGTVRKNTEVIQNMRCRKVTLRKDGTRW